MKLSIIPGATCVRGKTKWRTERSRSKASRMFERMFWKKSLEPNGRAWNILEESRLRNALKKWRQWRQIWNRICEIETKRVKQMSKAKQKGKWRSESESWGFPLHSPRFLNKISRIQIWAKNYNNGRKKSWFFPERWEWCPCIEWSNKQIRRLMRES